ncbi:MAG: metallophosphoesterase [Deltaproteobacteria bacterium]|nr:metallophosphoesterase [Deltaproteobacteria bacterium]
MGTFVFVTDLHGSRWKYERTLALAKERGASLVINGGDMLPHGRLHEEQARFIREFLDEHFAGYQASGIRHLGLTANDDLRVHDPLFEAACAKYPLVENIAKRRVEIGPHDYIGMNLVTDFPFRLKDRARMDVRDFTFPPQFGDGILSLPGGWEEIPDWPAYARALPTIEEELFSLPAPRDPGRAVYVIHGPPARLGLDVCRGGMEVGSFSTFRFIESLQPLLTLHGHIHESPDESGVWLAKVGRTVCIQPGQSSSGLTVVVGDLESMRFEQMVIAAD